MKKMMTLLLSSLLSFSAFHLSAQNSPPNYQRPNTPPQEARRPTFIEWCDSYSESLRRAQETSKPLLILFTGTSWCPACMRLEREVLNNPQFIQAMANKFIFYKAEFSEPTEEAMMQSPDKVLVDRYGISAFPTMVAIDGNGRQLFTIDYKTGGAFAYISELNQRLQGLQQAGGRR